MNADGKFGHIREVALTADANATAEEEAVLDKDFPDETDADGKFGETKNGALKPEAKATAEEEEFLMEILLKKRCNWKFW